MPPLAWEAILAAATAVFSARSFPLFAAIASGWVLCPARHTLTGIQVCADPLLRRAHDCFAYFFRDAAWDARQLCCVVVRLLPLSPAGPALWALHASSTPEHPVVQALIDDTLTAKTGRHINGSGSFRDPIRSTAKRVVYAWGLNAVVLCIAVRFPFRPQPIALPVDLRIYRKGGPTHCALTQAMLADLLDELPAHFQLLVTGDGAYASLAASGLPRCHFCSRLRRDAALYDLPAPRCPGQRGRPRLKGARLPALADLVENLPPAAWQRASVGLRGRTVERLLI